MSHPDTPRTVVERFVRASAVNDWDDLADCYAPEVEIEMPFAPPGFPPKRVEQREDMRARFKTVSARWQFDRVEPLVIHETGDPEVIIAEYTLHGTMTADARQFEQTYVMVITVRDGAIVASRDYGNPITGARLLGMLPQLMDSLAAEG